MPSRLLRTSRRIPEATVARLPVYLRCLLEVVDAKTPTISSERLAEMAGVNAAKVRKDLSYLGSYGTRGVGYDVEYLFLHINRVLGLTQDWPVVIVGVGNLGQALANYGGFSARGFRIVALLDADRRRVGEVIGDVAVRHVDDLPEVATDNDIAIGIIATPADAAQDVADRLVAVGVSSILNFAPAVITVPRRRLPAQGRPVDRAADPRLLPAAPGGRRPPSRHRRWPPSDDRPMTGGRAAGPVDQYPGEPRPRGPEVPGGRRRRHRRAQGRGPARLRGRRHGRRPPRRRAPADASPVSPSRSAPTARARSPATGWSSPPPTRLKSTRAVFHDGEDAGVWVNGADDPANCSFTLPSVLRRGPLMVTVSTGGRSPALSRWLRQRLEADIGPEYEVLLDLLSSERDRLKAEGRSTEGPGWQNALDSDMLGLIRTGDITSAREHLHACLSSSSD